MDVDTPALLTVKSGSDGSELYRTKVRHMAG